VSKYILIYFILYLSDQLTDKSYHYHYNNHRCMRF